MSGKVTDTHLASLQADLGVKTEASYTKVLESGYSCLIFTASSIGPLVHMSLGGIAAPVTAALWSMRGSALT